MQSISSVEDAKALEGVEVGVAVEVEVVVVRAANQNLSKSPAANMWSTVIFIR